MKKIKVLLTDKFAVFEELDTKKINGIKAGRLPINEFFTWLAVKNQINKELAVFILKKSNKTGVII